MLPCKLLGTSQCSVELLQSLVVICRLESEQSVLHLTTSVPPLRQCRSYQVSSLANPVLPMLCSVPKLDRVIDTVFPQLFGRLFTAPNLAARQLCNDLLGSPCCAVLCCAVLCCAVLCCAVLCCDVMCCSANKSCMRYVVSIPDATQRLDQRTVPAL